MPITKKFEWNSYREDFEEVDEHSPLLQPELEEEELDIPQKDFVPKNSFLKKCKNWLKNIFFKIKVRS